MVSKAEGAVKTVLVGNTHRRPKEGDQERDRGKMNSFDSSIYWLKYFSGRS